MNNWGLLFPKQDYKKVKRQRQAAKRKRRTEFGKAVFALDSEKCRNRKCIFILKRSPDWLEPHHIIYRSHKGPDMVENGITLCAHCHECVHRGDARQTGRQIMIEILEQHIGEDYWRWDEAYEHLKRREGI